MGNVIPTSKIPTLDANTTQSGQYGSDGGATDAYAVTLSPAITAYGVGIKYRFYANTANTGAASVNFNGLGPKTIVKLGGGIATGLADNDIRAGQWVEVVYDGTNMQMESQLGNASGGGGSGGTKTLRQWTALDGQAPATDFATIYVRNYRAVLEYDDTTSESMVFVGIMPEASDFTVGIQVRVAWLGKTATSGNVVWSGSFERGTTDVDSDSFATAIDSGLSATSGTSGIPTITVFNFTGSEIDGVIAGDLFFFKLARKTGGVTGNMVGDAQVMALELQQR